MRLYVTISHALAQYPPHQREEQPVRDMTVNPYRPGAVPFDMPDYIPEALAVVATGGTIERNEHGCWQSVHVCSACDERFTVCPPSATWGDLCKAPECTSYEEPQDGPFTGVHVRIDLAAIADNYVIHECDPADATHLVVPRPAVAAGVPLESVPTHSEGGG